MTEVVGECVFWPHAPHRLKEKREREREIYREKYRERNIESIPIYPISE